MTSRHPEYHYMLKNYHGVFAKYQQELTAWHEYKYLNPKVSRTIPKEPKALMYFRHGQYLKFCRSLGLRCSTCPVRDKCKSATFKKEEVR